MLLLTGCEPLFSFPSLSRSWNLATGNLVKQVMVVLLVLQDMSMHSLCDGMVMIMGQ